MGDDGFGITIPNLSTVNEKSAHFSPTPHTHPLQALQKKKKKNSKRHHIKKTIDITTDHPTINIIYPTSTPSFSIYRYFFHQVQLVFYIFNCLEIDHGKA